MALHWTTKWLGRPWVEDEYECAEFTIDVLRAEFGVPLGARFPRPQGGVRRHDAQFEGYLRSGMVRQVVGAPREGDGVLMRSAHGGRLQQYHVGVYVEGADGAPHVLHLARDLVSVLQPVGWLEQVGYTLVGYYRWAEAA